jgi:hypothetical protein
MLYRKTRRTVFGKSLVEHSERIRANDAFAFFTAPRDRYSIAARFNNFARGKTCDEETLRRISRDAAIKDA